MIEYRCKNEGVRTLARNGKNQKMKSLFFIIIFLIAIALIISCETDQKDSSVELPAEGPEQEQSELEKETYESQGEQEVSNEEEELDQIESDLGNNREHQEPSRKEVLKDFKGESPTLWGENLPGVITHIDTSEKIIVLTFDACGGTPGKAYDEALIQYLRREKIPATLFFTGVWIKDHPEIFTDLAEDPLFEVANHGYRHKPLSVNGEKAYGIPGTSSIEEAYDEIMLNQDLIRSKSGQTPRYFRSGTAYYDDVAVDLIKKLGLIPVNYNVLGDAGATFTKEQIIRSMETAEPGAIILFHMNHPDKPIAEGVEKGVERLRKKGFSFVTLGEYHDRLR